MTRTTLNLDPTTLKQLKGRARREHKSMGQVASELLAQGLGSNVAAAPAARLRWSSWRLGTPRIDLEDKEAVRAAGVIERIVASERRPLLDGFEPNTLDVVTEID